MKKRMLTLLLLVLQIGSFTIFASAQTPAEQIQAAIYETEETAPQLFDYLNGVNWIEEIALARNIPQEERRDYTIDLDKVAGMYDLGNRYAENWKNNKDTVFTEERKIWAFPYYYAGDLHGAIVVLNTNPYSYSIVLDNSNRLLNLMFDPELLDVVLENNGITQVENIKAIFGTYSASPSVIYLNNSQVLPVNVVDYDSITVVGWQQFVDKQAEEDAKGNESGLSGGGGVANLLAFNNRQIQHFVFGLSAILLFAAIMFCIIKRRSYGYYAKVKRRRAVGAVLASVMALQFAFLGISPVNATAAEEDPLTMENLPDTVFNAIKDEITPNTELVKDGFSDLCSITTTENDGTKTIFSFQEPIKFKDENNVIRFKSDKLKKTNKLFSAYEFQNEANDVTVYLPKKIKSGVLMESEDFCIQFQPITNKNQKAVKKDFTFRDTTEEVIEYSDVFGEGTALQYKPLTNGVKENIVLEQYNGQNTFQFYLDIGDLEPAFMEGESIPLLDPETKEIVTVLGQVDARDSFVGDCPDTERHFTLFNSLSLVKDKKNGYILTVTVDAEFLESETTVYPVVIDPITYAYNTSLKDTTIYSNYPTTQTYYTSSYLNIGDHGSYGEGRALIKISSMSSFTSLIPDNLVDVTYHIYEGSGKTSNTIIRLRDTYATWTDSSVIWNAQPGHGDFVSDVQISSAGWKEFPLKYLFESWLLHARGEGGFTSDYGFYLVAYSNEDMPLPASRNFCSADSSIYKPYIKVTYNSTSFQTGVYYIKNVQSGKYLDVNGQYTESGTNVHQWSFHGGQSQQWQLIDTGDGYYYLHPMHAPTMSLDLQNNYSSNESNIWIYGPGYTGDSAKWSIIYNSHFNDGSYRIICKASSKAMVVQSAVSTNGANVIQYDYTYGDHRNDDWILERADTTLNVPLIPQAKSNWCWAACAEMLARTQNIDYSRTQSTAAMYTLSLRDEIIEDNNVGGFPEEIKTAAEFISNFEINVYCVSNGIYSPSALTRVLRDGSPVIIQWGWLNDENHRYNGHSVVIYGFYYDSMGELMLKIKDPWDVNIGSTNTRSYKDVKRVNNDRVWESFQTFSGSSGYTDYIPADISGVSY